MEEKEVVIELRQVVKRFFEGQENELEILHGVDLQIRKGEFVSIVGESGSGKSTLMNIIGVLDRPTGGTYYLGDMDVAQASDKELSKIRNREIGFVFQTYNLISRTSALKNVEMPMIYAGIGRVQRRKRAEALLEIVGMADRSDHMPDELSGGQKQRVAIASAIYHFGRRADRSTGFGDRPQDHGYLSPSASGAGHDDRADHTFQGTGRGDPAYHYAQGWQYRRREEGKPLC